MKLSIKKIFQNLNLFMLFMLFFVFSTVIIIFENQLSYQKNDNLYHQKSIISSLKNINSEDTELILIQLNGKGNELLQSIDKIERLYKFNFIDKYILQNENEYIKDLNNLRKYTIQFNINAKQFYIKKDLKYKKIFFSSTDKLYDYLELLLKKENNYNTIKSDLFKNISLIILLISFIFIFWYRKRLNSIYKDIEYLYQIDRKKREHEIYTAEADAILLRIQRKTTTTDNPTMLDPITGINNHKGMINSYSSKKHIKDSNFTSVTIIEINNFSKTKRVYSQEITQSILKKVAYTISLHEQPIDVIARTDYNQFTIIFSRHSKEQAFKDIDLIRQSIEELKFTIPDKGLININISGGFVIKPNNTNLDEAIKQAKEILIYAKSIGTNKILQIKDMAERHI